VISPELADVLSTIICRIRDEKQCRPAGVVSGRPLRFVPHDFRRVLITDAIMQGMQPRTARFVAGHRDIDVNHGIQGPSTLKTTTIQTPTETPAGHPARAQQALVI